ncbi:Fur family transcriptional regulator [Kordiimonas laminariae]|uniref:Fur family transcriptional regulator n=1 Tax=Kordiimonas laminariae TaxID=2917717 RepID=UPI001FF5C3B9|nr:transcriptional repressor [Kordiimonas laminariae]MCK0068107.1 transcriptional repressor [Kordiimonas laminariae]
MKHMELYDGASARSMAPAPGNTNNGYQPLRPPRLTNNQAMVYDALLSLGRSAKAYELLEILRPQGVNTAPTIYRALTDLTRKNLVRPVHSTRTFTARPISKPFTKHSILMICEACGHVDTIENPALQHALEDNASSAGFTPRDKVVEIMTLCREETCPSTNPGL